jgi:transposase-like protein
MTEEHIGSSESKGIFYAELEEFARGKSREHWQDLLEQEVTEWLGREKSERRIKPSEQPGYRNGYGKPRRFTMSLGTLEVCRPRGERFGGAFCLEDITDVQAANPRGAGFDTGALFAWAGQWGF